ncbi:MAG: hypothetical protein ACI90V_012835 [Bacillariaceae sp.]|jgi:hypothetical protein
MMCDDDDDDDDDDDALIVSRKKMLLLVEDLEIKFCMPDFSKNRAILLYSDVGTRTRDFNSCH